MGSKGPFRPVSFSYLGSLLFLDLCDHMQTKGQSFCEEKIEEKGGVVSPHVQSMCDHGWSPVWLEDFKTYLQNLEGESWRRMWSLKVFSIWSPRMCAGESNSYGKWQIRLSKRRCNSCLARIMDSGIRGWDKAEGWPWEVRDSEWDLDGTDCSAGRSSMWVHFPGLCE